MSQGGKAQTDKSASKEEGTTHAEVRTKRKPKELSSSDEEEEPIRKTLAGGRSKDKSAAIGSSASKEGTTHAEVWTKRKPKELSSSDEEEEPIRKTLAGGSSFMPSQQHIQVQTQLLFGVRTQMLLCY